MSIAETEPVREISYIEQLACPVRQCLLSLKLPDVLPYLIRQAN